MRKRHCGLALRRLIIRALRRVFIGIGLPYCRTPSPPFGYGFGYGLKPRPVALEGALSYAKPRIGMLPTIQPEQTPPNPV
jgi:hypothetical protein